MFIRNGAFHPFCSPLPSCRSCCHTASRRSALAALCSPTVIRLSPDISHRLSAVWLVSMPPLEQPNGRVYCHTHSRVLPMPYCLTACGKPAHHFTSHIASLVPTEQNSPTALSPRLESPFWLLLLKNVLSGQKPILPAAALPIGITKLKNRVNLAY